MWVDFHWHGRDEEQAHKETIARSLAVAEAGGLDAIAAMPNTARPLITLERCQEYLAIARDVGSPVKFYVHIGLTPDVEQVKRAVEAYREEPGIIGMKAYWGRSTGDLSVIHEEEQLQVIETLAAEAYDGVLASHCEKEALMNDKLYDPNMPVTWSTMCRKEESEYMSFYDILDMSEKSGFTGTLHVCHVSTVEAIEKVFYYDGPVRLSCGVTPHHLFLNSKKLQGPDGAWYKCNPPLRSELTQTEIKKRFKKGLIPIIESDHAPHTEEDKEGNTPASGIANAFMWPYIIEALRKEGMSDELIHKVAFENAVKLYGLENEIEPSDRPIDWDRLKKLRAEYPFDAFKDL